MSIVRPKAISIRQPWAWAIIYAGKDIENRSEGAVRGMKSVIGQRIFVHAAKTFHAYEFDEVVKSIRGLGIEPPRREKLGFGGVIGSVKVVDIVARSQSPWYLGQHGLLLSDPRPCKFFPVKGVLGLFYVDPPPGIVP